MIDYKLIGARLKKQRQKLNITQELVAEKVEISTIYLSKIENGHVRPTLEVLAAICDALNCDLGYILSDISLQSNTYQNEQVVQLFNACAPKVKPIALELLKQLSLICND